MTISSVSPGYKVSQADGGQRKAKQRQRGQQEAGDEHDVEARAAPGWLNSRRNANATSDDDATVGTIIDVTA